MPIKTKWAEPSRDELESICLDCPAHIFRAYDIRGKTTTDLTPDVAYLIGRAIGAEAIARGQRTLAVGRDCRETSGQISDSLKAGLLESGVDVVDIGMVPTPVLYFSTYWLKVWSGVMVTGSHNPKDYNGLKIVLDKVSLSGSEILNLLDRIRKVRFVEGKGKSSNSYLDSEYLKEIEKNSFVHERKFNVVVDAGNGMAGVLAPKILRKLGHNVIEIFCNINGDFPNHHPDPSQPENLEALKKTVSEENADIGLAFDGDGDRLGVVDSSGQVIWPDRQMILLARDLLSREPNSKVVYDVKSSRVLKEEIEKSNGIPIMSKTGHSFIKKKMLDTGALLGGEMSGHLFLKERWYGFDDAICSAVRLLEVLSRSELSVDSAFLSVLSGVSTPELILNLDEGQPQKMVKLIQDRALFDSGTISTIDGLRVEFEDSWGLVRASNTTPCLVFRFEGDNNKALDFVKSRFRKLLAEIDSSLKLPF